MSLTGQQMTTMTAASRAADVAGRGGAWRSRGLDSLWPTTLLALAVRVATVLASPHYRPNTDAYDFNRLAVNLAHTGSFGASAITLHGGPTAMRPPLFSLVLSLIYRVVGTAAHSSWEWGRMAEAVMGAVVVACVWLIAARLWDRRVAHVAGLIAAVYPPLIMVGSSLLSEAIFIPLLMLTVLCGLRARSAGLAARDGAGTPARALVWCAATGVALALTALARSNGVVIGLPLLVMVWTGRPRRSPIALAAPVVLVVVTAVSLVPWTLRNERVFGSLVPTTTETGYALEGIYNPILFAHPAYHGFWIPPFPEIIALQRREGLLNEAQISTRLTSEAISYVEAHPARVAYVSWWNLRRLLDLTGYRFEYVQGVLEGYPVPLIRASMWSFWLLGLVTLAGVVVLLRERRRGPPAGAGALAGRAPASFWWCPGILFLTLLPIIGSSRYRSPIDPFLIVLAALALVRGGESLRARRSAPLGSPRR